jgi:hypothetical protein
MSIKEYNEAITKRYAANSKLRAVDVHNLFPVLIMKGIISFDDLDNAIAAAAESQENVSQ